MRYTLLFLFIFGMQVSAHAQTRTFRNNSKTFKKTYKDFLGEDEKIVKSWYHYVTTKTKDKRYIARVFYPETKQIVSKEHYTSKKYKKRDGPAEYWFENGNKKSEGSYIDNKAEGKWVFYHRKAAEKKKEGICVNGQQEGNWKFYDSQGRLDEEIHYENGIRQGAFVSYDTLAQVINKGFYQADTILTQDTIFTKYLVDTTVVEMKPCLKKFSDIEDEKYRERCSAEALLRYIYSTLKYPKRARKFEVEGQALVYFVIEKDGSISEIEVAKGLCEDIKIQVHYVVSNMPEWSPGMQNGEAVRVQYTLPVRFRLD